MRYNKQIQQRGKVQDNGGGKEKYFSKGAMCNREECQQNEDGEKVS